MNPLVRELAFRAMAINQTVSDENFFVEVSKLKEFEHFANLLIKECISICSSCDNGSSDEWDKGIRNVSEQLKQHFGVDIYEVDDNEQTN